jgi:hypothetical protein
MAFISRGASPSARFGTILVCHRIAFGDCRTPGVADPYRQLRSWPLVRTSTIRHPSVRSAESGTVSS